MKCEHGIDKDNEYGCFVCDRLKPLSSDAVLAEVRAILSEYQNAAADFAGTNSCVDDNIKARLYMKYRKIFSDLQLKYIKINNHFES